MAFSFQQPMIPKSHSHINVQFDWPFSPKQMHIPPKIHTGITNNHFLTLTKLFWCLNLTNLQQFPNVMHSSIIVTMTMKGHNLCILSIKTKVT